MPTTGNVGDGGYAGAVQVHNHLEAGGPYEVPRRDWSPVNPRRPLAVDCRTNGCQLKGMEELCEDQGSVVGSEYRTKEAVCPAVPGPSSCAYDFLCAPTQARARSSLSSIAAVDVREGSSTMTQRTL